MKDLLRELWEDAFTNGDPSPGVWSLVSQKEPHFSYAALVANVAEGEDKSKKAARSRLIRSLPVVPDAGQPEGERCDYRHIFIVRDYLDEPVKLMLNGSDLKQNLAFAEKPEEVPHKFASDAVNDPPSRIRDGETTFFGCFVEVTRESLQGANDAELDGSFRLRLLENPTSTPKEYKTIDDGKYFISYDKFA